MSVWLCCVFFIDVEIKNVCLKLRKSFHHVNCALSWLFYLVLVHFEDKCIIFCKCYYVP